MLSGKVVKFREKSFISIFLNYFMKMIYDTGNAKKTIRKPRQKYDSDRIDRVIRNAKNNGEKLRNNDDLEIMELYNSRKYNLSDIGYQFNRSGSTIRRSLKRM